MGLRNSLDLVDRNTEKHSHNSVRLSSYFDRWIEMAKVPRSFDGLDDLMLRDQFIHICSQDLRLFLKERIPDNLLKMADLTDKFKSSYSLERYRMQWNSHS